MSVPPGKIGEIDFDPTALNASLRAGLEQLDQRSTFEFAKYARVVLPVDGFVFWKPTGARVTVNGSMHFMQEWLQEADQAIGYTRVVLTSEQRIQEFAQEGQNAIFVATYKSQVNNSRDTFRYAFSAQAGFYGPAGLWHYVGYQIPPALLTQLLDPGTRIDQTRAVVSNSIPMWLGLRGFASTFLQATQTLPIYPSFQAAENATAPYVVVDVLETEPLNAYPVLGVYGTHSQWCKDTCRVTMYGLQNNEALTFQDFINQYSLENEADGFGIMNMPVVKDVHRVQAELHGIAMKKEMTVEVSYNQQISTTKAYQFIEEALYDFYINPTEQPQEEGLILIPYSISEQSLTGGANLVAGILNTSLVGTTPNPTEWGNYAGDGTSQAINLQDALAAINTGSGVDWSFLSSATLVELEWNVALFLNTGETNFDTGIVTLTADTMDANGGSYSLVGGSGAETVTAPLAASLEVQVTGRTIAPVESGLIHFRVGIQPLTTGANAFSDPNSAFSVLCRVVGYQI